MTTDDLFVGEYRRLCQYISELNTPFYNVDQQTVTDKHFEG